MNLSLSVEYLINVVSETFGPDWTGGGVDQKLSFASFYALPPTSTFAYQGFSTGNTVVAAEGVAFGGIDMTSAAGQTLQSSLWSTNSNYNELNNEVASFNSLVAPPYAAHAAAVYGPTSGSVVPIGGLNGSDPTPLETVLAAGHPIAFMTQLGVWYPSPTGGEAAPPAGGGIYTLNSTALAQNPPLPFDHAMLIVGYDSTKQVFRIKNSWGAGWNGNGFADVSYGLLLATISDPTYVSQIRNPSAPAFNGSAEFRGFWAGVIDGQPGVAILDHGFLNPNEKYEHAVNTGYFYGDNGEVLPLNWVSGSYKDATLLVTGSNSVSEIFLSGGPTSWSYSAANASQIVETGTWCRSTTHPGTDYLPTSYAAAINDPYLFPAGTCIPQGSGGHVVAPFVRHDSVDSVMHYCNGGDLCELSFSPGAAHWLLTDMTTHLPSMHKPAEGPLSAHLRTDGIDSINFMDHAGDIDEMYLTSAGWSAVQGTAAPYAGGKGYSRSDGINAVVYNNASNGHLTELSLKSTGWWGTDLGTAGGAAPMALGVPFGWVRQDKVNSVVYVGTDGTLYETYLPLGGTTWATDNLSKVSGAWTKPVGEPSAYVRSDAVSSVVYRGTDSHVYEAALPAGASWQTADLHAQCALHGITAPPAETDPQGYKRGDNINAVDYADSNGHVWEMDLTAQGWWCGDITARVNAPAMDLMAGSLAPYTRADGISAIVYKGIDGHMWELSLPSSGWAAKDLTADAAL